MNNKNVKNIKILIFSKSDEKFVLIDVLKNFSTWILFHFCLEKEKYRGIIPLSNFKIYFYPKFLKALRGCIDRSITEITFNARFLIFNAIFKCANAVCVCGYTDKVESSRLNAL